MIRELGICALALVTVTIPLRAGSMPHAGTDKQTIKVWTNEDLEKLHHPGLISIVGQVNPDTPDFQPVPEEYVQTNDPAWYADQAAKLNDELEYWQEQLRQYQQAINDTRSLRESTGGVDLNGGFAITPEAGIDFLQQRVDDVEARLDNLADLARRNDIDPGTLRGQ
jgi:hypothetical protein